ncbi:hypothetical protein L1887_53818 [Cichorium endivia]|nr:hypothetical protein L1887_53818 [Cichorium endivia]
MSESPSSCGAALERALGLACNAALRLELEDRILGESTCCATATALMSLVVGAETVGTEKPVWRKVGEDCVLARGESASSETGCVVDVAAERARARVKSRAGAPEGSSSEVGVYAVGGFVGSRRDGAERLAVVGGRMAMRVEEKRQAARRRRMEREGASEWMITPEAKEAIPAGRRQQRRQSNATVDFDEGAARRAGSPTTESEGGCSARIAAADSEARVGPHTRTRWGCGSGGGGEAQIEEWRNSRTGSAQCWAQQERASQPHAAPDCAGAGASVAAQQAQHSSAQLSALSANPLSRRLVGLGLAWPARDLPQRFWCCCDRLAPASRFARSRRAGSRDPDEARRLPTSQHRNIATLRHRNIAASQHGNLGASSQRCLSTHAASRGERTFGCQSSAVHSQPRVWSTARARNICLSALSRLRRAVCLPASGRTSEVERIDACRGLEAARSSLGSPPVTRPFHANVCPGLRRISLSQSTLLLQITRA